MVGGDLLTLSVTAGLCKINTNDTKSRTTWQQLLINACTLELNLSPFRTEASRTAKEGCTHTARLYICGRSLVRVPANVDTTLCGRRKPSDYVNFLRAVKRQRFHTLNTHDTKARTTQQHSLQTPYTMELDLGPFPLDIVRSFLPEWPMAPSVVRPRKRFPPRSYTWAPL